MICTHGQNFLLVYKIDETEMEYQLIVNNGAFYVCISPFELSLIYFISCSEFLGQRQPNKSRKPSKN